MMATPDPGELFEKAKALPVQHNLSDYIEVIFHLRRHKNFSYRAIAAFLLGNGVIVDHNQVYRCFTKHHADFPQCDSAEEGLS